MSITGSGEIDIMISGSGDDVLNGLGGDDFLDAGDGADILIGGAGRDYLDGGHGADIMIGGADDDIYRVDNAGDVVIEQPGEGFDTVFSLISLTLSNNVERLVLGGQAQLIGTGNALANELFANDAGNRLFGRGGNDMLVDGNGDDWLDGGAGNDSLYTLSGRDTLLGGIGNDRYFVDSATATLVENENAGADTVIIGFSLSSFTLGANFENLVYAGRRSFRGFGNALANAITGGAFGDYLSGGAGKDVLDGGAGNDTLIGGEGADRLIGGIGTDTARHDTSNAAVVVNLLLGRGWGGQAEGDVLSAIENVVGSAFDDILIGDRGANLLTGGGGADRLEGGDGNDVLHGGADGDVLIGGAGLDTASYLGASAAVSTSLTTGIEAKGDAAGDSFSGIENVIGGNGADRLVGDSGANVLNGSAGTDTIFGVRGNDTIIGGAGADILDGGRDIDTLSYAGSAVGVTVNLGDGTASGGDANGDSFVNFENLTGSEADDSLTRDAQANLIRGRGGDENINGGDGDDTIIGGAGADTMTSGAGIDTLSYAGSIGWVSVSLEGGNNIFGHDAQGDTFSGFENLTGSNYGDALYGDGQANVIRGGGGNDYIDGHGGNDILVGGTGFDAFAYEIGGGQDRILDFDARGGETISIYGSAAFDSFAEIMAVAHAFGQDGRHTLIEFDSGNSILLYNVAIADLTEANFVF